jgi:putative exporter of polyketide antibiotics
MVDPKYRHPTWLRAIWVMVCVPASVLGIAPSLDRLIWKPTIVALVALLILTCLYNKTKTGMLFPGAKKNAPKEGN